MSELGIIGAGNMAEAIARGVIDGGLLSANDIVAADVSAQRREHFTGALRIRAVESNAEAARSARRILLSVKPQQMAAVLAELGTVMDPQTLVISIAAGISSGFIEQKLGIDKPWRVVRVMPNTPMLVGEGMAAIAAGSRASADDVNDVRKLFEVAASVVQVDERKMDAVTAVSGSGPAYVFFLAEQMIRAGVELGLTEVQAHQLATRTVLGAARMLVGGSDTPQQLRRNVTSPGGTTHAAITHMESQQMGQIIVNALKAADRRSKELGM